MKGPGGYEALRGSVDLRSAQAADGHRRTAVTITEMTGHDAETVDHDQPKCAVIIGRNVRSRSRNRRSRWAEIRTVAASTPEQLQDVLDECDLDHWVSKTQALPSRFEAARHAAVQLLKPNVVHVAVPKRTLNDEAELQAWLAEVEALIRTKLKSGPVSL